MYQKTTIIGYLGQDPEMRYMPDSTTDGQQTGARHVAPDEVHQLLTRVGFGDVVTRDYEDKRNGRYKLTQAVRL